MTKIELSQLSCKLHGQYHYSSLTRLLVQPIQNPLADGTDFHPFLHLGTWKKDVDHHMSLKHAWSYILS